MKKRNQEIMVTQLDPSTLEQKSIPMSEAIMMLSGCWKQESIQPMLMDGAMLWTPYFDYFIPVQ